MPRQKRFGEGQGLRDKSVGTQSVGTQNELKQPFMFEGLPANVVEEVHLKEQVLTVIDKMTPISSALVQA